LGGDIFFEPFSLKETVTSPIQIVKPFNQFFFTVVLGMNDNGYILHRKINIVFFDGKGGVFVKPTIEFAGTCLLTVVKIIADINTANRLNISTIIGAKKN
jgi:hypothetical protein